MGPKIVQKSKNQESNGAKDESKAASLGMNKSSVSVTSKPILPLEEALSLFSVLHFILKDKY